MQFPFIFLNTYKLVLMNMIAAGIEKSEVIYKIQEQVKNINVLEAINNLNYTREWFESSYIDALENCDSEYLYNWAKNVHNKSRYKTLIKNILIKLNI